MTNVGQPSRLDRELERVRQGRNLAGICIDCGTRVAELVMVLRNHRAAYICDPCMCRIWEEQRGRSLIVGRHGSTHTEPTTDQETPAE